MNENLKKSIGQFALYLVVGGLATLVEWAAFYLLDSKAGLHYMAATVIALVISTFSNWLFGRLLMFHTELDGFLALIKEVAKIYAASLIGILLNMLLMWCAVDLLGFPEMLSKMAATGIVFIWNFLVRKLLIYKI